MQLENTVSKILQNSCTVYIIYTLPLGTYRELEPPPPLMAREERKGGKLKNYQLQPTPPQPTPEKKILCAPLNALDTVQCTMKAINIFVEITVRFSPVPTAFRQIPCKLCVIKTMSLGLPRRCFQT